MRRLCYLAFSILLTAALLLAVGCGSSSNTTSNQPPSNQPPGNQPPPGGTPPPAAQTAQYEAALLRPGKTLDVAGGQIMVNANGSSGTGQVTASNGVVSGTYTITFLPFTNSSNAMKVGTVTSDASGNIKGSFTFSQKGTFAGIFHLSSGTNSFNQDIDPLDSGVDDNSAFIFHVPLVKASAVSPAISSGVMIGSDALGSGTVVAGQGKLHVELKGAAANATYNIVECGVNASSSCQAANLTIATDASGNATLDQNFFTHGDPAVVFEFFNGSQLEYVSGFTVQ